MRNAQVTERGCQLDWPPIRSIYLTPCANRAADARVPKSMISMRRDTLKENVGVFEHTPPRTKCKYVRATSRIIACDGDFERRFGAKRELMDGAWHACYSERAYMFTDAHFNLRRLSTFRLRRGSIVKRRYISTLL